MKEFRLAQTILILNRRQIPAAPLHYRQTTATALHAKPHRDNQQARLKTH